jgi:murein DD-endopeptidase MepM/ murein hydrolase activator NlpD
LKKFKVFIFFILALIFSVISSDALAKYEVVGPVKGSISSTYGYRTDPFTGEWAFHEGLDINAPEGSPVYAIQDGVVIFSGWRGGYGLCVIIDHNYPDIPQIPHLQTKFGHNSKLLVKKGEYVQRGQLIALVGSTGRSTGPHLHFEVRYNGYSVDPMQYMTKLPGYLDYVAYFRAKSRYTSYASK